MDSMTARNIEMFISVDRALHWYENWFRNRRSLDPRPEFWDAVDSMIELFSSGLLPAECRRLERQVIHIGEVVRQIDSGELRINSDRFVLAFNELSDLRDQDIRKANHTVREACQEYQPEAVQRVRRQAPEQAEEQAEEPAEAEKPLCPETWDELFALKPPIGFEQLMAMKQATIEEVYSQARRCGAIDHLPPEQQAAARQAMEDLKIQRRKRDQQEAQEAITAACGAAGK